MPNPNQLILVREMQKAVCVALRETVPVPVLPLCVKSEKLQNLTDKISKAVPESIFFKRNCHSEPRKEFIFLSIDMTINGKQCKGTIELCKIRSENDCNIGEKLAEIQEKCAVPLTKIKKISPFRIVELETEEYENGRTWRVLSEKWGKL